MNNTLLFQRTRQYILDHFFVDSCLGRGTILHGGGEGGDGLFHHHDKGFGDGSVFL